MADPHPSPNRIRSPGRDRNGQAVGTRWNLECGDDQRAAPTDSQQHLVCYSIGSLPFTVGAGDRRGLDGRAPQTVLLHYLALH